MPDTVLIALTGTVQTTAKVNVRQGAPNRVAPVLRKLAAGSTVAIAGLVIGEPVQGNAHWYRIEESNFIWSGACAALVSGPGPQSPPAETPPGAQAIDPSLAGFGLDPQFATKLTALLAACRERGHRFRISQGLRTPSRQAQYYCKWAQRSPADIDAKAAQLEALGAPWTAQLLRSYRTIERQTRWLTDAAPGAGWHQWGEAADCYCYRDSQMVEDGGDPCYRIYADLAQQIGLTAGFYFTRRDSGHVQLRPGNATNFYGWPEIDQIMQQRFGDKPGSDV